MAPAAPARDITARRRPEQREGPPGHHFLRPRDSEKPEKRVQRVAPDQDHCGDRCDHGQGSQPDGASVCMCHRR